MVKIFGEMKNEKSLAILLFAWSLFSYSYFFHFHDRWPNPNETTRLYSSISMAEDGEFFIDRQIIKYGVIWDRAEYKGRLYSDKAPGLSLMAVIPLAILHKVSSFFGHDPSFALKHWLARFFCVILPSALFSSLLFLYLRRFLADPFQRAGLIFIYTTGTLACTFSTLFFGHQTAAVLLFTAFVLLEGERTADPSGAVEKHWNPWLRAGLGGFLLGLAAITEYPVIIAGFAIFVFSLVVRKQRAPMLLTVAAGLVPVFAWLAYNKACFDSPFSLGYSHLDNPGFAAVHKSGLLGVGLPNIVAFAGSIFGPKRGLLFFSPVCIFGFIGFFHLWKAGWKQIAIIAGIVCLVFLWIASSFGYWIGGDVVGPRHLTPLIPFLMIPMAAFLESTSRGRSKTGMILFTATAAVSIGMTATSSIPFPFFFTPLVNPFRDMALALWSDGIFPYNPGRFLGLKGIYSAIPYLLVFFAFAVFCFSWLVKKRITIICRALPLVCLWFAIVINILPSGITEENRGNNYRLKTVYSPAGEDLLSLRLADSRKIDEDTAKILAAQGKTAEALEASRWMK